MTEQNQSNELPRPARLEDCDFQVKWSNEDKAWIATCPQFPSLATHDEDFPDLAIQMLADLTEETIYDLGNSLDDRPPEPEGQNP